MDLSVNGAFKTHMKEEFTQWYADTISDKLASKDESLSSPVDLRISLLKPLHANWIMNTFDTVSKDKACIKRGWHLAGLID